MTMLDALVQLDWLRLVLVFFTGGILALLFHFQRRGKIRLEDLIIGEDNRVSLSKFCQLGAFLVSTWGFVVLVDKNQLSEWYYFSYMVAWSGAAMVSKAISAKAAKDMKEAEKT